MTIAVISMIRDAWGGSEELWHQMAKVALKQGHTVIHMAYEYPQTHTKMKELEEQGLTRLTRPGWIPPSSSNKKYYYLGVNYLKKKIQRPIDKLFSYNPDVILYNGTCYSIAGEKELLRNLKSRPSGTGPRLFILGHYNHDSIRDIDNFQAAVIKEAFALADKVFFVSTRSLETAKRHLCSDIPNGIVLRNPVNLSSTEPLPFPSLSNGIRFATVGNLITAHKGQDVLIDALSKWEFKDWTLNMYGSGPDKEYIQNLIAYLHLENKITLHGSVSDIRKVWQDNHALLMPSHMEGMPLAVVEAMLCARVCIATDTGGISEWIEDRKSGFIAPASTVNSLLSTLQNALEHRDKWEHIAQEAHKTAILKYDPQAGQTLLNNIIA